MHEEVNENLAAQICEMEALQSVYPQELVIADHGVLADINDFIKNPEQERPQRLEYSIELSMNGVRFETVIRLTRSEEAIASLISSTGNDRTAG